MKKYSDEEGKPTQMVKRYEKINVASELYLLNRSQMLECEDEYSYYRHLIESIEIGVSMLGSLYPELKQKAIQALSDPDNYFKQFNIDYLGHTRGCYAISTGKDTGTIVVRPSELEIGEHNLKEQQASTLIMKFKPLNNEIFELLMEEGLIKKRTIEDMFEKMVIDELRGEIDA